MLGGHSLQPPPSCKAQALFTASPACHDFHTFTQGRKEEGRKGGRKREKEKGRKERGEKVEDMKCVRPRDALSSLCSDPTPLLSWSCPVSNTENESTENKILRL